jgi:PTS system nitrogen regulatory IIA component
MEISGLLSPERVLMLRAGSKTDLLRQLARRAAELTGVNSDAILAALNTREGLGCTGIGDGIAIPHAGVAGVKKSLALFARLDGPTEFGSVDERPVDLVVLLLTPAGAVKENIAALAAISRRLRDKAVQRRLREAHSTHELYEALMSA